MSGTFVETPSRALTIEHEPTGREISVFKPEQAREDMGKLDVLASLGANLRDDKKLYELAVKKLEIVVDIVEWLDRYLRPPGNPQLTTAAPHWISVEQAHELLGYTFQRGGGMFAHWRSMSRRAKKDTDGTIDAIVLGWKMRAGLEFKEKKPKKELDHDLAVEAIFRAYTKLDPDQRIELKQKIMDFEKSYKDPFAGAKEW